MLAPKGRLLTGAWVPLHFLHLGPQGSLQFTVSSLLSRKRCGVVAEHGGGERAQETSSPCKSFQGKRTHQKALPRVYRELLLQPPNPRVSTLRTQEEPGPSVPGPGPVHPHILAGDVWSPNNSGKKPHLLESPGAFFALRPTAPHSQSPRAQQPMGH